MYKGNLDQSMVSDSTGGSGNKPLPQEAIRETNYSKADERGNPCVNLATGRLKYMFDDVAIGQGNFNIAVSHVYSSKGYGAFASKIKGLGNNWKLNLTQIVVPDNYYQNNAKVYKYLDESGEVHRFVQFDTNRYYDDRNAQITLIVKEQEYVIRDGLGNKLYFNLDGLLTRSVSCHNASIQKIYNYDTQKRLVSVYDSRTVTNGKAKSRIELQYGNGCLTSVTSYGNFNSKLFGLAYGYDSGNNLVSVSQVAFNKAGEQCISKPLLEFAYSNGQLSEITDTQTKQGYAITYDGTNGKVTTLSAGAVTEQTLSLGMTDSNGQALSLGQAQCGTSVSRRFVEKSCNKYIYKYIKDGDKIAYETDVTNKDGITLAYFIDRNACITSTFEKDGNNLKTLNKQGAKRTANAGSDDAQTINGSRGIIANQNPSTASRFDVGFGITGGLARNEAEKALRHYEYSFWLKIKNAYKYPKVSATFVFSDTAQQITERVLINGSAVNAWQRVSVPVTLPVDSNEKPFNGTLQIFVSLLNNNVTVGDTFEINEIGFAPAPRTVLQFETETNGYVSLDKIKTAMVETNKGVSKIPINEECFFTESDVIASYTNRYAKSYIFNGIECFDVVCNNGTKLLTDIQYLSFCVDKEDTMDFRINTTLVNGSEINVGYSFGDKSLTVKTTGISESGQTSSTTATVDYKGKTLSQTDEYGVKTEYTYDAYGSLTGRRVVAGDGTVGAVENYAYNADGSLFSVDNGLTGQKYEYTEQGQVCNVTELARDGNGSVTETGHSIETQYGVYKDKPLNVTESIETETIGKNEVTYEQGRIRTVTDGTVKYGVKQDNASDRVEYTQFDGDTEKLIQDDASSTGQRTDGSIYKEYESRYFNESGRTYATVKNIFDTYGRITDNRKTKYGKSEISGWTYQQGSESEFAQKVKAIGASSENFISNFYYDEDGNLTSWQDMVTDDNGKMVTQLDVKQLSGNVQQIVFDNKSAYFYAVEMDNNKTLAPRITSVKNYVLTDSVFSPVQGLGALNFNYIYDNLGRVTEKVNERDGTFNTCASRYKYNYKTAGSKSLVDSVEFNNYKDGINSSLDGGLNIQVKDVLGYNDSGDISKITATRQWIKPISSMQYLTLGHTNRINYTYDSAHRLVKETNEVLGIDRQYSYNNSGRLTSVTGTTNSACKYNSKGQLTGFNGVEYGYDIYGNRISRAKGSSKTIYEYDCGGRLKGASGYTYGYNANGQRIKKTDPTGKQTIYYLNGDRVLRETKDGIPTTYYYDNDKAVGINYLGGMYKYVYDSQGNVSMIITYSGKEVICMYEYDSYGNCKVYDNLCQENTKANFIGNVNPFRWKGLYYDTESNLYYINGNYYDPETGLYVNATSIENTINSAYIPRSLDRNGLLCNNTIELSSNNTQENLNSELVPVHNKRMLKALPSIPQWLALTTRSVNDILTLSVYARTIWYMRHYPSVKDLMKLDGQTLLPGKYTNFINGLAYGFVALDTVLDIYSNIQQDKSVEYIIGSAAYTAVTGVGIVWSSGKIGAFIGTKMGGPLGTIVGGVVGFVVGILLTLLSNLLKGVIFK